MLLTSGHGDPTGRPILLEHQLLSVMYRLSSRLRLSSRSKLPAIKRPAAKVTISGEIQTPLRSAQPNCQVRRRSQLSTAQFGTMSRRVPIESQRVDAPLTQSATFLVLSITDGLDAVNTVRSTLASVGDLAKNVSIRDLGASFVCTVGIGSDAWARVTHLPRPAELHPFPEVKGAKHTAVSTPGDLLFHIRSERRDLCFEFEKQLLDTLGDAVKLVDETVGFRYFDVRDLLGFVDGTANPVGPAVPASILVAEEDASVIGGSYSTFPGLLESGCSHLRTQVDGL